MNYKKEDKQKEYDIMRVVLTLFVVIGHSAYLNMPFGFGGVDYSSPESLGNCLSTDWYVILYKIVGFVYFFHMPAFFFLSGAVFCIGMRKEQYPNLQYIVENKAKRLIFPALVAGVFWMVPLKFLGNGYSSVMVLPYAIWKGVFLTQGTGHLWYLFTLFWIFFLSYILLKYLVMEKSWMLLVCILMLGTFYSEIDLNLPGGNNIFYYLIFFLVGYCFEKFRARLIKYIYVIGIVSLIVTLVSWHYTATVVTTGMFLKDWVKTIGISSCIILIFVLCHFLTGGGILRDVKCIKC